MGYYTTYSLEIVILGQNEISEEDIIDQFRKEYESAEYALDDDGSSNESCKWYDSKDDLVNFSKKHSGTLFLLSGTGEESGDLWKLYVRDGKHQFCKARMVFDEFDEFKMV